MKPIGYSASKYFFVLIETHASRPEAILQAWCKSPFILILLYLLDIWEIQKAGKFAGFRNNFVVTEPSGLTLKCVSKNLVRLDSTTNFMFSWWEFILANNSSFLAVFWL